MMEKLKKIFKIEWMNNRLWLLLASIGLLFFFTFFISNNLEYQYSKFLDMEYLNGIYDLGYDLNEPDLDKKLIKVNDDLYKNYHSGKSKEIEAYPEDFLTKTKEKSEVLLERFNLSLRNSSSGNELAGYHINDKYYGIYVDDDIENYEEITFLASDILSFIQFVENETVLVDGHIKIKSDFYLNSILGVNFFAILLAIVLMSLKHLTSYYEFTRMFPWKNQETFIYTVLYGLVWLLAYFIIINLANYATYRTSFVGNILGPVDISPLAFSLLEAMAIFFVAIGVGSLSGNILGHLGMMLIGFLFVPILDGNIGVLKDIFTGNGFNKLIITETIDRGPDLLAGILNPVGASLENSMNQNMVTLGFFILGLIYLVIGMVASQRVDSNRSKMLVMDKSLSKLVGFLAITTTAAIFYLIVSTLTDSKQAGTLMYILGLFISYKFYKMLFNIQIGA